MIMGDMILNKNEWLMYELLKDDDDDGWLCGCFAVYDGLW